MKNIWKISVIGVAAAGSMWAGIEGNRLFVQTETATHPKGCVYKTIMNEEQDSKTIVYVPENVQKSINKGILWLMQAQQNNGGWGAGLQVRQDVVDPHAVGTDPATTSMAVMALLRSGYNFNEGVYKIQMLNALNYLLKSVEETPSNSLNITTQQGTQIQGKLGQNIDVILTAQCLSNVMNEQIDAKLKERVKKNLESCTQKIQTAQNQDGSFKGAGWAGVLQSSFAANALESAEKQGVKVDKKALERSKDYQKNKLNTQTGTINTDDGAGIMLYSVSGSTRSAAKEAREVEESLEKARKEGKIATNAPATAENLRKIGYDNEKALRSSTAYQVYNTGKSKAQDESVMQGFGNNGGEEFLSYLQTGESLIISKDKDWKTWYQKISARMLNIQEKDGSWKGHHCITSPVFCTATTLLILSVENDLKKLEELGK